MSQSQPLLERETAPFAGARVVARIRLLVVVAAFAAFGYFVLMASSKGYCAGGISGEGFIDSAGNAVAAAPSCIQLTLRPSGVVFLVIVAIVFFALSVVLRRARTELDAISYLNRAAWAIGVVVVASVVISHVWFFAIPITEWDGTGTFIYPFPFGTVEMLLSTMTP